MRPFFNIAFFIAFLFVSVSCYQSISVTQSIGGIYQKGIELGIFDKTETTYSYLNDSVGINPLFKPQDVSITIDGIEYKSKSSSQPLHVGDNVVIYIKYVNLTINGEKPKAYITFLGANHQLSLKENLTVITATSFDSGGNSGSSSTSTNNNAYYSLECQVPDVKEGEYLVTSCISIGSTNYYEGFGYISIAAK